MPSNDDALILAHARELLASGGARDLRTRHGFSQQAVARTIGVSLNAYHGWENQLHHPPASSAAFRRYAHLLGALAALESDAQNPLDAVVGT